jgi:hypothetical protein
MDGFAELSGIVQAHIAAVLDAVRNGGDVNAASAVLDAALGTEGVDIGPIHDRIDAVLKIEHDQAQADARAQADAQALADAIAAAAADAAAAVADAAAAAAAAAAAGAAGVGVGAAGAAAAGAADAAIVAGIVAAQLSDAAAGIGGGGGGGGGGAQAAAIDAALLGFIQAAAADDAAALGNAVVGVVNPSLAGSASLVVTKSRLEKDAEDYEVNAQFQLYWMSTNVNVDFPALCNHYQLGLGAKLAVDLMPYLDIGVLNLFKGVYNSCLRDPNGKISVPAMYGLCSRFAKRHAICGFKVGTLRTTVPVCVEVSAFIDGTGGVCAALNSMRVNPCTFGVAWDMILVFAHSLLDYPPATAPPPSDMSAEPF